MSQIVVNGFATELEYQRCTVCIHDSTVPGICFNTEGICNFCDLYDLFDQTYPCNDTGEALLQKKLSQIRHAGRKLKYDCIIGISGGRDSCFLLYCAVRLWGLRPLAVHFNDGFDNPIAGKNMKNAVEALGVELRTITSNWHECRDLKIAELKASTPLLNSGTDVGIGASLYSVAAKENVKCILFGQSFRTEGIKPLSWAYINGDYLRDVHKKFGEIKLRRWKSTDAGYHLGIKEMAYYVGIKQIRVFAPLYYYNYIRTDAEKILRDEFDWVYPGGHYFDDLYWALIVHIHRVKFNVDLRLNSYSALIRSGQMNRTQALELVAKKYVIEDDKIIELCLNRLALSREEFDRFLAQPAKRFTEVSSSYNKLLKLKLGVKLLARLGFFPETVYHKYFNCGA